MALSLKTEHIKRYKDVAQLFVKYGRSDLLKSAGIDAEFEGEGAAIPEDAEALARNLADDLERLGPTFIKLGQLLSTRPDLLPVPFIEALARLQDKVEPFPFPDVEAIVTAELGVRLSKLFREFEREPIAAASLGQVHRAWLRDGRPGWSGLLGGLVLLLYGVIPTLQTAHFGRVYAVYGGFFIVLSLLWGWYFDGHRPDRADVLGGAVALLGVCIMMYWPRGAAA